MKWWISQTLAMSNIGDNGETIFKNEESVASSWFN